MWSVWPAQQGHALGPDSTATRAAVGGITLGVSGLDSSDAAFSTEQHIGSAEVMTPVAPCSVLDGPGAHSQLCATIAMVTDQNCAKDVHVDGS